ncbi:MAG: prolyl oligopeptidase family serine peptidase [Terracidiphilus sp.]
MSQQQNAPLSVKDALLTHDLTLYSPPRISPDGKWLAYTLTDNMRMHDRDEETWVRTGVPVYAVGADIFLLNFKTGDSFDITGKVGNNWLPSWSPDGRSLAFVSDRDCSGQAKIWIYDLDRKQLRPLSGLKTRMLSREIQWTPDGRALLVATMPRDMSTEEYVRKFSEDQVSPDIDRGEEPLSAVTVYRSAEREGRPVTSDPWSLNLYLCDLTVVDLRSGESRAIVRSERIGSYRISPDGAHVAYSRMDRFEQPGSQQILFSLLSVGLEGTSPGKVLAAKVRLRYDGTGFSWSPDSAHVAYRALGPGEATNDCYVVNSDGTQLKDITRLGLRAGRYMSRTPVWDATGEFLYFTVDGVLWRAAVDGDEVREVARIPGRQITAIVSDLGDRLWRSGAADSAVVLTHDTLGRQDGFYRVDLASGTSSPLLEQAQCYTCRDTQEQHDLAVVSPDGNHILYLAEDAQHDTDIWLADRDFKTTHRVTNANPQFSKYVFASSRLMDWLSDDGQKLRGTLLLPPGFDNGKRYPLVVMVYGGDTGSDRLNQFGAGEGGPFNLQLLATRGFAVLLPDAPQNLGTPMLDLAKSVLPGVNKVVELGIADPERLGVLGESYGGYSVMSLLVQTARFKAAVETDGYGDIIGSYGAMRKTGSAASVSNEESGQGLMGGPPWEYPLRYVDNSPIFYLSRVNTPLLIAHGAEDDSVGTFLGDELFVGLRRLGKKVEYAKYQGEGHYAGVWSYANQQDYANRMIDWFERHLMAH